MNRSKKQSNSGNILMIDPVDFPDGLSVRCDREVKDDSGFCPKQTRSMSCY